MEDQKVGMIKVTKYEENEDGSANLVVETSSEATRMLVEEGLLSLLEKAVDKENKDYDYRSEPMSQELIDSMDGFEGKEERVDE